MAILKEKQSSLVKKALKQYENLRDTVAVIEAMGFEKETGSKGVHWEVLKKKLR